MASPEVAIPTCKYCLNEQTKTCLMCQSHYCVLHSAKFSPNFCKDCLTNLSVIMDTISRTSTEYDMLDDELVTKVIQSKTLQLDGPDWIFYRTWIDNLSEENWLEVYQLHYFVLKYMEYQNEVRKIKRARRIAQAPLSVKMTKEAKTKKVVATVDMQAQFEKMNIPVATIKAMLQAAGIPYREPSNAGNNGNG